MATRKSTPAPYLVQAQRPMARADPDIRRIRTALERLLTLAEREDGLKPVIIHRPERWRGAQEEHYRQVAAARWEISESPCPEGHGHRALTVWWPRWIYACGARKCMAVSYKRDICDCGHWMQLTAIYNGEAEEICPLKVYVPLWVMAMQESRPLPLMDQFVVAI